MAKIASLEVSFKFKIQTQQLIIEHEINISRFVGFSSVKSVRLKGK